MRKVLFIISLICLLFVSTTLKAAENNFKGWQSWFPDGLITADGSEYDVQNLDGKLIGLYFAAGWCRNCCAFSKIFVPFRNKFKDKFEVILVNFDDQEKDMMAYMKNYHMEWAAIPYNSSARLGMKNKFKVSEIPTLIVMTPDGKVLTKDGRPEVQEMGDNAIKYWQDLASQIQKWSSKR